MKLFKIKELLNHKLIRTGSIYSASSLLRSIIGMLTGLLMLRWLDPAEIGMWQAITIIQAYLPFVQLGIQSGLNRDLPVLLGKGETERGHSLIATAKQFAILLAILFIVISFLLVIVLIVLQKPTSLILGVVTIGIMAACFSYQNHLSVTFRSANSFDDLARVNFIYSLLSIALLYFIYRYHYYGILIYNVLAGIALAFLTHYARPFKEIKPHYTKIGFSQLLKTGLLMMSFNQIRAAALSIPKIIILKLNGIILLGLYAPALAVNSMFGLLPGAIAQFFHPQMGYKYGKTSNARDLWGPTRNLFWLLILVGIPISAALWFTAPFLLKYIFPKYIESLWPMRIMSVAFIFSSAYTTHGVLYSIKAYKYGFIYSFAELLGYIIFPGLFAYFGTNLLVDITIGILFNNILLSALNFILLKHVLFLPAFNRNT
jgi:O-antigen/teichoic acid export membrane protein